MAASVGAAALTVSRRRAWRSFHRRRTGDARRDRAQQMRPGAIYNSNRFTLRGLIEALGCECNDLGIVPDRLDATRERCAAAQGNDLIVTSGRRLGRRGRPPAPGGAGRRARRLLADGDQAGQTARLRRGAPRRRQPRLVHGPAGQPVSSFITFLLVVRPALMACKGARRSARALKTARRFRLAAPRQTPRIPARAPQRGRRAGPVPQPELGRADLGGVGRWRGRQPFPGRRSPKGDRRFPPFAELLA